MAIDKEVQKQKSVLFPKELFKKIDDDRKIDKRSFSSQVVHICEEYYKKK